MSFKPLDDRQVLNRAVLQQIFPWVGSQTLDIILSSINADLTPSLKVDAQNPTSLTVNIGPSIVSNSESDRNHSISFINNILPIFSGGTVTFPSTSGGNIATSTGGTFSLTLPSNEYVQVLIYLDQNANLQILIGEPTATLADALVPNAVSNTLPFAYVTLFNNAGTIGNITQSDIYQIVGGGGSSGSGGINYITNPDAEASTLGWNLYQNTAANIPSNGTGGTPTGLTFVRSTSNPLIGLGSFLLTQANSTDVQGEGVSTDFTIDSAYQANILNVSFNYNASNTFVPSDGITAPLNDGTTSTNSGNSDVEVFIYDVTNGFLIPVTPEVIVANGSNNFSFAGYFQTSTNSVDYRLILHCATANANATGWQFKFDNVVVGPASLGIGNISITPTQTILTSGSGSYTPPSGCSYIRVKMVGGGGGGGSFDGVGSAGSATTFGTSLLTANAGGGGGIQNSAGGAGGSASVSAPAIGIAIAGAAGTGSGASTGGQNLPGSPGAATPFAGGGAGGYGNDGSPGGSGQAAPANSGGGGGGGASAAGGFGGSAGGGAGGYIEAIITSPLSSYSYSVGSGGSGASPTGSYGGGGNGADGVIIIDEFYVGNGGQSNISKPPTIQIFDSGSGTYTLPTPAPLYIEVEMIGGGGGGSGTGPGPGGGGAGGSGGTTTFGSSLLVANGGGGATGGTQASGGSGGSASITSPAVGIALRGGDGSGQTGTPNVTASPGAGTPFGGGGGGGSGTGPGLLGEVPGAGGGGGSAYGGGYSGGGGGAGGYVKAIVYNPSPSYSFSVGVGGTAGAPLNDGTSYGGGGAAGIIIVTEYYAGSGPNPRFNQLSQGQMTPFSSSGTFTTSALSSISTIYKFRVIGGGGGGGGTSVISASAGGGGSGGYAEGTFTGLAPNTSLSITVGGAGSGGSPSGGDGGSGGTSSIVGSSINVTCNGGGGGGGSTNTGTTAVPGGSAGGITSFSGAIGIANNGGNGGLGIQNVSGFSLGGTGAPSAFGSGGPGAGTNVIGLGYNAGAYGAGGGGGVGLTANGGIGGSGIVIIEQLTP